jgi:hypothetical protein
MAREVLVGPFFELDQGFLSSPLLLK